MPAQRSSGSWSASATARITARMSNGFLRPGSSPPRRSRRRSRGPSPAPRAGGADVAVARVTGLGLAREALARRRVGVLVVGEQDAAGAREVGRAVLRLAVRAHDALVAADAEVVLRGDPARVVERLLAGEHHRALGRHHEDALGVHEHRRLGVPVRLRADVDAGDDDVDLAARLGEVDDAPQRGRDPVHVLGAGVHRDPRAGGEREPLHRHARSSSARSSAAITAPALGLGQRAQAAGRVAEQDDALHPLGVALGAVGDHPDHDARRVRGGQPLDGNEPAVIVEVVLGELPAGSARRAPPAAARGS